MTQLDHIPGPPLSPREHTMSPTTPQPADTAPKHDPITVTDGYRFHLRTPGSSYAFHETYGDLMADHWGGPLASAYAVEEPDAEPPGWMALQRRRELGVLGAGDFRAPALVLASHTGCESYAFKFDGHALHKGKPALPGMPSTFGSEADVTTLEVRMRDKANHVLVRMFYAVWREHDVISRWTVIENHGEKGITVKKASQGTDLPAGAYELAYTYGNWAGERRVHRAPVGHGVQG